MDVIERATQLRPYIVKAAQSLSDTDAVRAVALYDEWSIGTPYEEGYKVRRIGNLWRCIQPHTSQAGWQPENAPSLFERIDETHKGTDDDPIPYSSNMALKAGLYYSEGGVVYLCTRDTENPVYNALSELVGIYVDMT